MGYICIIIIIIIILSAPFPSPQISLRRGVASGYFLHLRDIMNVSSKDLNRGSTTQCSVLSVATLHHGINLIIIKMIMI